MSILKNEIDIPLVVIGDGGKYKQQVKDYLREQQLESRVIFLSESQSAKSAQSFKSAIDFPAIYQLATAMIYPSFFEGFGIPVLEALWSKIPVITSNVSCLPEVGGKAAYYVNPASPEEIADAMRKLSKDKMLVKILGEKGWEQAQNFTPLKCAGAVMDVYNDVTKNKRT